VYNYSVADRPSFSRGCSQAVLPNGCLGNTCVCNNTDNCNNQQIYYGRGTLQCYSCASVDFMDNGCGPTLNPDSHYVNKISGCVACGKDINNSTGHSCYKYMELLVLNN